MYEAMCSLAFKVNNKWAVWWGEGNYGGKEDTLGIGLHGLAFTLSPPLPNGVASHGPLDDLPVPFQN